MNDNEFDDEKAVRLAGDLLKLISDTYKDDRVATATVLDLTVALNMRLTIPATYTEKAIDAHSKNVLSIINKLRQGLD